MSVPQPKFTFVVDTSMFLAAIACSPRDGTDSNSELDKQVRDPRANHGKPPLDPQKIRGTLILLLLKGQLIVPEAVVGELTSFLKSTKLSEKNKQNLRTILPHLQKIAIPFTPTQQDLLTQVQLFQKIATKAQAAIEEIERAGVEIPNNWETLNPYKISHRDLTREPIDPKNPNKFTDRQKLVDTLLRTHRNHFCKFWFKNHSVYPDVKLNLERANQNNPTQKPYLLDDFSIFLTAQRTKAHIFTLDADFMLIHQEMPTASPAMKPYLNTQDMPKTMPELLETLKQHIRNQPRQQPPQQL
jgi:hypothetical protein